MTSSGIKRGLASTAIAALAVAGLPLLATTASAVPLADQAGGASEVVLATPGIYGDISTKNDGQNTTYRLQAVGGTNVANVRFEYSLNGGTTWQPIATVGRTDNGSFAHEWNAAGLDGATIDVRAVALDSGADVIDEDSWTGSVNNESGATNVDDGDTIGVFQQPYAGEGEQDEEVILTGTSTNVDNEHVHGYFFDPTSQTWIDSHDGDNDWVDEGQAVANWSETIYIDGYTYGPGDQILLGAEDDESDDAEAFALYKQTITAVTAVAADPSAPSGDTVDVTVTVTDQNGRPISGAQVFASDGTGPAYTNDAGEAVLEQDAGSTNYYYANATDQNEYSAAQGDQRSGDVAVGEYVPGPSSLDGNSRDGSAFDNDEYELGDVTVQVQDQNGNAFDSTGQTLEYYWVFTPFDGGAAVRTPATGTDSQPVEVDGEFIVPMPALDADGGTYELFAALSQDGLGNGAIASSKVLTVKAGQAEWTFDEAEPEVAPVGGDETIGATLALADGTGLADRPALFTRTTGTNSAFNQESGADATTYATETNAEGHVEAVLDDPNTDTATEAAEVTVATTDWTHDGDTDNAGATSDAQSVVFAATGAPAGSTVTITADNDAQSPGETQDVTVTVLDNGGNPVTNTQVTLTVDEGYFTNEAGTTNLGQEITVVTDGSGVATADIGIGRNEGFDDDGEVTSIVTATSGAASDTEDYDWTTETPVNGSEVDIFFSANQTVGVLPKAPFETETVCLDVLAFDEFGNPVAGEQIDLSGGDFTVAAENDGTGTNELVTDLDDDCDVVASADSAGNQTVTATWEDATFEGNPPVKTGDLSDSITIEWYAIQVTTVTLTASGADPRPVGSTVTMTYKAVDQHGEPIDGYTVEFYRSGPDNTHDGDLEVTKVTNAQGEAYYVFQGETKGTATITTVLYNTAGDIVPEGEATETVTFGGKLNAGLTLKGNDNGAAPDDLFANAIAATEGAVVKLFRKKADGTWAFVEKGRMNSKGNHRFNNVPDKNGKAETKYKAVVKATDTTRRGVGKKVVR